MPDHHGCENLQFSWRHVQLLAGLRGQRAPQQQAGMAYCTRQCIEPGAAEMLGGVPARWRTAFQATSCSGTESVSRAMKTDTTAEGPAFRRHPLARGRLYVQYRGDALQAHDSASLESLAIATKAIASGQPLRSAKLPTNHVSQIVNNSQ